MRRISKFIDILKSNIYRYTCFDVHSFQLAHCNNQIKRDIYELSQPSEQ